MRVRRYKSLTSSSTAPEGAMILLLFFARNLAPTRCRNVVVMPWKQNAGLRFARVVLWMRREEPKVHPFSSSLMLIGALLDVLLHVTLSLILISILYLSHNYAL